MATSKTLKTYTTAAMADELVARVAREPGKSRSVFFVSGNLSVWGRITPAGTFVLSARHAWDYTYGSRPRELDLRPVYIRAQDPRRAIIGHLTRLALAASNPVHGARQSLHDLAETRAVPDDFETRHPAAGKTYDEMTSDDVAALWPLVQALPLKHAAEAAQA
jgi:hypothetical protein